MNVATVIKRDGINLKENKGSYRRDFRGRKIKWEMMWLWHKMKEIIKNPEN